MREIKFRIWNKKRKEMFHPGHLSENSQKEHTMGFNGWPLMQFTGILDKNGKEIYENDIVKGESFVTSIQWTIGGFNGVYHNIDLSWDDEYEDDIFGDDIEVIGNIYQNPELLK